MKSEVILYYKSLLNKEKNFVLDVLTDKSSTITDYLGTLDHVKITGFQYVKQQLSVSIKIDSSQVNLEMVDSKDLNYVSIANYSENNGTISYERVMFYFVIAKTWRSKNTIELVLSMDTLNSFEFNKDYLVSAKSIIKRQHKDRFFYQVRNLTYKSNTNIPNDFKLSKPFRGGLRFYNQNTGAEYVILNVLISYLPYVSPLYPAQISFLYFNEQDSAFIRKNSSSLVWELVGLYMGEDNSQYTALGTSVLLSGLTYEEWCERKIDLKSEDISCPVYKSYEKTLYDESAIDWKLYYKNSTNQQDSPVDCFLIPSESISIRYNTTPGVIDTTSVSTGDYLIFFSTYPSGQLSFRFGQYYERIRDELYIGRPSYHALAIKNNGADVSVFTGFFYYDENGNAQGSWHRLWTGASVEVVNPPSSIFAFKNNSLPNATACLVDYYKPSYADYELSMTAGSTEVVYGNITIDKTLEENLKIINVPYSPTPYTIGINGYEIDDCWEYDQQLGRLKLVDFERKFIHQIGTTERNLLYNFDYTETPNPLVKRNVLDSKLYHSDYCRNKFVYDSFSRIFPLEQLNIEESLNSAFLNDHESNFAFTFVMSRNIVSKFLFKFDFVYKFANEDYPNVVAVARNNEEVLYNSAYLNYVRTGYNYDLKSKERNEVASGLGIGLNVASLIASGVIGLATGNPIAVAGAVASGIGLVGQLVNFAKTTAQNEENVQRKLVETQRQAVSVLSFDFKS